MKKFFTLKMLALVAGMLLTGVGQAWAGDGTKANPYTVAELNAQKDALAASGETVWVKADLKGLGVDGSQTVNGTTDANECAGLFGDAADTFVAYSYQILGNLDVADLTNTKDLLIGLTYGTVGHPYGNTDNPQYATDYEAKTVTDAHFSLVEVHNALSVNIENGLRGYHISSSYIIPEKVIAVKVNAGYSSTKGAYVTYTNFDGAEATSVTPKDAALVLMANSGTYDFVLTSALYDQTISNGNAMSPGTQAGVNAGTTKNRTRLVFVSDGTKAGFQKNSDENCTVTLQQKSDVFLQVSSQGTNFYGNYAWETEAKDWITWAGGKYSDFHAQAQVTEVTFDFASSTIRSVIGTALADVNGNIYNETFTVDNVSLQVTAGSAASKLYKDEKRGQCLVTYKDYTTLTFKAPEGYAITKIAFTAAGSSNINNFTCSSGAVEGMIWTGNAEGVRFNQGGTSYLANAIVTLAAKDGSTTDLPAIEYKECANIAAFNALAAGTYAKVALTDAEVIGKSADGYSTVWIQDATGGCWIQYTSLNAKLVEKTKINGYVYVVARPNSGNVQMKEAEATIDSEITATEISDYTIAEGTIAEVNVAANLNKVVKITGATLEETSATAGTLAQGDVTIAVNNGNATANQQMHKIAEWAKDTKLENVTIVAILVGKSATENQLLPISITTGETGIANVNTASADHVVIYNLRGARLNQLQKGVNIVNGRNVVIK